jgi:hypothetical protein
MTTKKATTKSVAKKAAPAPASKPTSPASKLKTQLLASLVTPEAPVTPLTKLLLNKGFVHAKSELMEDELNTAHGYTHEDGSAAMFIHANVSTDISARWILKRANGNQIEGKTAKQLAVALIKPEPLPANVTSALSLLRKLTKGSYRLLDLAGDSNYTSRVQLLKRLRNTEKVLVKDSGLNALTKLFYEAVGLQASTSAAATAMAFEVKCAEVCKLENKADRAVIRVEKAEIAQVIKATAKPIHDGKPILPSVKKLSAAKQAIVDEQVKADLVAQIKNKRRQEEYTPLAVPRPEASIAVNLEDVCLLEDPANGIILLCLEKPNSQGAICVYNNGSRVAAGVLPTERLMELRSFPSEDLVKDINQFLHPITAGVIVTPVAETHLTAVLAHCKEKIDMATETAIKTKKFAAPKNAATKSVAKKAAEKTEKAPKAAKKAASASTRTKFTDDLKIKALVKENPYKEGTKARDSFDLILKSKTFGDYAALTEKSKKAVYPAAYFTKWASQPHGKAPAYITLG